MEIENWVRDKESMKRH